MSGQPGQTTSEGAKRPGDNPNKLNAKPRQGARPRTKNSTNPTNNSMRLGWIDPLPQVDVIHPLGLEPNPEAIPAGEIELDFSLPQTIAEPFAQTINSVGDRIQMTDEDKELCMDALRAQCHFKAARQLYSTMLDSEKSTNQPLKSVFYDETPIPAHMGGALGIIGHMDTKVGKVMIRDAGLLFKRWIAQGLHIMRPSHYRKDSGKLIWLTRDDYQSAKRLAREEIDRLVKQSYLLDVGGRTLTVSMPQLTTQRLDDYYSQINNSVPNADELRALVSLLQATYIQWRDDDDIPNNMSRHDILLALGLELADGPYLIPDMRESFEEFTSKYTTDIKWRIESIFKVGPPPAGSTGYGAQTVSSTGNVARWQMPLSDADVNIGFLFSPVREFKLYPRLVGYSKRSSDSAKAEFASADGKQFVN